MLLTEQEAGELWRKPENYGKPLAYAKAIEIAVIEKIKAQGPVAEFGELSLTPGRLERELAATIKERNAFQDQCIRLEQKRALEKFELAEVKHDAERYRWLRNKVAVLNDGFFTVLLPTAGCEITEDDKVETDEAIDEAIRLAHRPAFGRGRSQIY